MYILLIILLTTLTLALIPTLLIRLLAFNEESKKQIRLTLDRLVKENRLSLEDVEFFGRKAIGLDKNKKLVFVDCSDNVVNQFCIDLDDIFFCRVNEIRDEASGVIKEVFIELKKKNYNESLKLTFYNRASDKPYTKIALIKKANHWKDKINLHKRRGKIDAPLEYIL